MTQSYVINAFVASEIINQMVPDQWRWGQSFKPLPSPSFLVTLSPTSYPLTLAGYYMFVIILPVCLTPVVSILFCSQIKASRLERERLQAQGQSRPSRGSALEIVKKFLSDMDVSAKPLSVSPRDKHGADPSASAFFYRRLACSSSLPRSL